MSSSIHIAKRTIGGARGRVDTLYHNATTEDIIKVISRADKLAAPYTAKFAAELAARHGNDKTAILKDVWQLLKSLRYRADDHHQKVKSPAQLIADGVGDCKSYSVFIASVCQNLNIKYKYRYADYDRDDDVNHVYIVAYPDSGPVVVDAVHTAFNREAPGAGFTFDIDPTDNTRTRINGVGEGKSNSRLYYVGAAVLIIILLS